MGKLLGTRTELKTNAKEALAGPQKVLQVCYELGEERYEFSLRKYTSQRKHVIVFFVTIYTINIQRNLSPWAICGSAKQPLQDLNGKILNQPQPNPSNKIK